MCIRKYLGILAFLISGSASAADYYYQCVTTGCSPQGTPSAAAMQDGSSIKGLPNFTVSGCSLTKQGSPAIFTCPSTWGSSGQYSYSATVYRYGDSCPSGTTYNSTTGACDAPSNPCLAKQGQTTKWTVTGNINEPNSPVKKIASTSAPGNDYYTFTRPPVIDGCEVNPLGPSKCIFKPMAFLLALALVSIPVSKKSQPLTLSLILSIFSPSQGNLLRNPTVLLGQKTLRVGAI